VRQVEAVIDVSPRTWIQGEPETALESTGAVNRRQDAEGLGYLTPWLAALHDIGVPAQFPPFAFGTTSDSLGMPAGRFPGKYDVRVAVARKQADFAAHTSIQNEQSEQTRTADVPR
jgi:hypothetical protein